MALRVFEASRPRHGRNNGETSYDRTAAQSYRCRLHS